MCIDREWAEWIIFGTVDFFEKKLELIIFFQPARLDNSNDSN